MREKRAMTGFFRAWALLLAVSFFFSGCASFRAGGVTDSWERPEECRSLFSRLDEAVGEAGVRDAASSPVPGFPYLRSNRFVAALGERLEGEAEKREWVRWMQRLDLEGRKREIANLPDSALLSLGGKGPAAADREKIFGQAASCSSRVLSQDLARADFHPTLRPLVGVPDEYSSFLRVAGLYPLTAVPVAMATGYVQRKAQRWFSADYRSLPLEGSLQAFVPQEEVFLDGPGRERLIARAGQNPLRVPLPDPPAREKLVRSLAPVFLQDVAGPYDRPGRVVWKGGRVDVDPGRPTVYYYLSHSFLEKEPVLQVNYVIWFSERSGKRAPWIELGRMDGLTVRFSLDGRGEIFMVDVINNCGCYHFFAPREERVGEKIRQPSGLDAFVPQWLPAVAPGERLGVRVNSGWHQVERLLAARPAAGSAAYELVPYEELESVPREGGRAESIFDDRGVGKGTDRVERYLLFFMGVPRVGSMRQRGHHAVEFIGRSHFDDPDLFQRNFVFRPGKP